MSNRRIWGMAALCLLVSCICLLTGCRHEETTETPAPATTSVEETHGDGVVQVDNPEKFVLATVEERPTVEELHVTGVVAPDVNRSVPVLSLSGGRAVEVRSKLGDQVTKGQVLMVIDSPDVSQAFSDYQKFQ